MRHSLALVIERNVSIVVAALRTGGPSDPSSLTALPVARTIADASEDATRTFVSQVREGGHTWQDIGEPLSITRQAAQERCAERAAGMG